MEVLPSLISDEAEGSHVPSSVLRQGMVMPQDPDFDGEGVVEMCLGFLKTAELRTGCTKPYMV